VLGRSAPPGEIDAAAERVQQQRMPEIEAIQALQQGPPKLLFGRSLLPRLIMDYALPLLARTGIAQRFMLPTVRRLTEGVSDVRLEV
jgi:hypothetical protein